MLYISSFELTNTKLSNPNIYPYNVFSDKYVEPFVFSPVTIFYGHNGCGKSTLLNLIALKLSIEGSETYAYGQKYIDKFLDECKYDLGEDEFGVYNKIPPKSRYIKSEDILFEIKKIQQEDALERGYVYSMTKRGMTKNEAQRQFYSYTGPNLRVDILKFAQEKYSNGETVMQMLADILVSDSLYLLDEPEVSLSPQNQIKLSEEINILSRYCGCQFIIATHSPFMLGTLNGKIYDMDQKEIKESKWSDLENVKFFYEFFKQHESNFL